MAPFLIAALLGGAVGELTVAVVPSLSGEDGPRLSLLYDLARSALEARAGIAVLPLEASFAGGAESVLERCGSDDGCSRAALVQTGADAALLLVLLESAGDWIVRVEWRHLRGGGIGVDAAAGTETVGSTAELEAAMIPLIDRVLDDASLSRAPDPLAATSSPPLSTEVDQRAIYETWWFWTAIGVAVAGSAVAIGLAARGSSPCLCSAATLERCEMICGDR